MSPAARPELTPRQLKAVDGLLHEALKRAAWERADFVRERCVGDQAVQQEVMALLDCVESDEGSDFLKQHAQLPELEQKESLPPDNRIAASLRPGFRLGPYHLLSVIGEGAFGIVYLAEQTEPIRRRVALKVLKPGMDSKTVIARFEAERQALALMDHPSVAKVFDTGTTEHGLPYFVMEYVPGEPITGFCDRHRLTMRQRLNLFCRVCAAVHHAHEKGVIHRDIKPTNVLVEAKDSDEPLPKVIDFGVAKATAARLTEKTVFTEQGQLIGTPEYMSPEQAEMGALEIDTRSDVYSLGVLLYELLAGVRPFDLRRISLAEMQRIIRDEEPPTPSSKLGSLGEKTANVAEHRRTRVADLTIQLQRELEWIPLKAMRKDRMERYRSAAELADDIGNYLQGHPLIAAPESTAYRVRKFLRRHRGPVAAVAAVALIFVLGVIGTTTGWNRATERARAAREAEGLAEAVSSFLLDGLLKSASPQVGVVFDDARRRALDAVSQQIEGHFEEYPLVEARIRATLADVYFNLGEYRTAEPHAAEALELYRNELGEEDTRTLMAINDRAVIHETLGHYAEAERLQVKALQTQRRLLGDEAVDTQASRINLIAVYLSLGKYDEAESLAQKALEINRRLYGVDHGTTLLMNRLAVAYQRQGRYDEAERLYKTALQAHRRLQGDPRFKTKLLYTLGGLYNAQGRYGEAEPLLVEAVGLARRTMPAGHPITGMSLRSYGVCLTGLKRYGESDAALREAHEILSAALGPGHRWVVDAVESLVELDEASGRPDEAAEWRAMLPPDARDG